MSAKVLQVVPALPGEQIAVLLGDEMVVVSVVAWRVMCGPETETGPAMYFAEPVIAFLSTDDFELLWLGKTADGRWYDPLYGEVFATPCDFLNWHQGKAAAT